MKFSPLLPTLATAAIFACPILSNAQTLAYDGFNVPGDYAEGISVNGVNGGTGFGAWNAPGFDAQAGSLEYTNGGTLATTAGRAVVVGGDGFNITGRTFTPVSTGSLWVSWLWSPVDLAGNANYSGLGVSFSGGGDLVYVGDDGDPGDDTLRVSINGSKTVGPVLTSGTTYFTAVHVDFTTGTVEVFFNPTVGGAGPGTALRTESGLSIGELGSLLILGNGNAATTFDEIRLGTTYASVSPVPEPSTIALLLGSGLLVVFAARRSRAVKRGAR